MKIENYKHGNKTNIKQKIYLSCRTVNVFRWVYISYIIVQCVEYMEEGTTWNLPGWNIQHYIITI